MMNYAAQAIQSASSGTLTYCKFLTANDTGLTGGHQAGIYISKPSIPILFDDPGIKGENKEKRVKVNWQNDFQTDTRFIYYGQGTRNEYRITNFGKGFPYLRPEYTGALFVLVKNSEEDYSGFILNTDEEINQFLDTFGIGPAETNRLVDVHGETPSDKEKVEMENFLSRLTVEFPTSEQMSTAAQSISSKIFKRDGLIISDPDKILLDWTDTEYRLFRYIEHARYNDIVKQGFPDLDTFISVANQIINRRKSRAGKSLEHHLSAIFDGNELKYTAQATTEGNKRPDFLFPSESAYHNAKFSDKQLISLAAKTTCKDRWRQIINEADRLRNKPKFLCTLQQGISVAQMDEMQEENVILVVPKPFIQTYPKNRQDRIWTLTKFVKYAKETEEL